MSFGLQDSWGLSGERHSAGLILFSLHHHDCISIVDEGNVIGNINYNPFWLFFFNTFISNTGSMRYPNIVYRHRGDHGWSRNGLAMAWALSSVAVLINDCFAPAIQQWKPTIARCCRHHHGGSVRDRAGQIGRWEQYGMAFPDTYIGTSIKMYVIAIYLDLYIENRQFQFWPMDDCGRAPRPLRLLYEQ